MNRKIFSYFEIAGKFTQSKADGRSFLLGSVAIRGDGAMVRAMNAPSIEPNRMAHSEYRVSRMLDSGATVYVARIRLIDGSFGMAKPCRDCYKILKGKRVKRIYYTINDNEYGVIEP
jgi:hypothetical protein